ncbi:MAG: glycosyltransferase family 2 protein [Nanoarchaeota archaeon]
MSLSKLVLSQGNDYSSKEEICRQAGFSLIETEFTSSPPWLDERVAVVLPVYNVRSSLPRTLLSLEHQIYKPSEVIVVQDGSPEDHEDLIDAALVSYDLHFIRNERNKDRSFARNCGIALASCPTILILDPDLVLNPGYILNIATRQQVLEDTVFIGFKHHVKADDPRISDEAIRSRRVDPDLTKDWRVIREYTPSITAPNFLQEKEQHARQLSLLYESDHFKTLGKGKVLGAWDLPSIVLGQSICCKRKKMIEVGGFVDTFTGWGHDDIAFATRVIAAGSYIVPSVHSRAFHIDHPPHSGSMERKLEEFRSNLQQFLQFVETAPDTVFRGYPSHKICSKANKHYYRGPV